LSQSNYYNKYDSDESNNEDYNISDSDDNDDKVIIALF